MSFNSRGSLCLSDVVWPSRWGALPRADTSCCFDSSECLVHISSSLFIISILLSGKCGSESEAPELQRGMARDQRSRLGLSGAKPQLRIGLTARSQECRPVRWHLC